MAYTQSIAMAKLMQNQANAASAASSGSDSKGLLSDGIMKSLLEKGLSNDFNYFASKLQEAETTDYSLQSDQSNVYQLYSIANKVIQSGSQMQAAEQKALSNNSMDAIAVDDRGQVFTFDGKKIGKKSLSSYNSEKERALTVGELIQARKEDPTMTFDNSMMATIANTASQEQIYSHIADVVAKIGNSESTTEAYANISTMLQNRLAKKPTQEEWQAVQEIAAIAEQSGIESALFKVKNSTEGKNLQKGLDYIIKTLPSKYVNQLKAQFVVNYGGDVKDSTDHIVDILSTSLYATNKTKEVYTEDFDSSLNNALDTDAAKVSTSKEKTRHQTTMEMFFNQNLNNVSEGITISSPAYKHGIAIKVQGNKIPALTIDGGSATVGKGPLTALLEANGKGMGKYLDFSKSYIGTDKVFEQQLNDVYYSHGEVANVWMPVDEQGNIDWRSVTAFSEAEDEIKQKGITDPNEKNQIHYKHNSPVEYDPVTGQYKNGRVAQFLYTTGYTIDDNLSDSNGMYEELKGDRADLVSDEMDAVYENFKTEVSSKQFWDDIVSVPVFIKIGDNASINASYYAKQGSLVSDNTIQQDMAYQAMNQQPTQPIYSSAAALYQE